MTHGRLKLPETARTKLPRQVAILFLVSLLLCSALPSRTQAAAGVLDPSFGNGGRVQSDFGGYNQVNDVAIQKDGKIVAVGFAIGDRYRMGMVRYNPDGSLDPSFGAGGKVSDDGFARANAVALQNDSKIVVAGAPDFTVARYNSNGSLDVSFGGAGRVTTVLGSFSEAADVVIQADGKIVLAGVADQNFAVVRYNSDGSTDSTFGSGGRVSTDFMGGNDSAKSLAIQGDGKIIVAGTAQLTNFEFGLARYNSDGSLDATFGSGGKVVTTFTGYFSTQGNAISIQSDGKLVVGGFARSYNTDFALARYNIDGSLDTNFGMGGKVTTSFLGIGDYACAIAIQSDGKIIAMGYALKDDFGNKDFALARYNPNGTLDVTFGNGGRVNTDFGGSAAYTIAIQSDGKMVVGGIIFAYFGVARYQRDSHSFDFDVDSKTDISIWRPSNGTWWILNSSTGNYGVQQWGFSDDKLVPADYDGDGETDTAIWRPSDGTWWILNSSTGNYRVQQWGFSTDIPVPGDYDGDGKADTAIFRPGDRTWWILNSSNGTITIQQWGLSGDIPVPGDYDGDGKTDIAVYRPSDGTWWILNSSGGYRVQQWGLSGDKVVPADYDGDGKTDIAIWRPSDGTWWILNSSTGNFNVRKWGFSDDIPVPGDYDGDGKTDTAIFRPSNQTWWILNSSSAASTVLYWGLSGDIPVPSVSVH